MRKFFAAMATVVVLTSTPVVGQGAFDEPTTIFRLSGSFDAWLKGRELNGVMAIRRGARAIETVSVGIAADAMVELASVSKSITAVCAAELVAADQMRWDDTLSETLDTLSC